MNTEETATYKGNFRAKIVDDFLTPKECQDILAFVTSVSEWDRVSGSQGFWDNRTLSDEYVYQKLSKNMGAKLLAIRDRIGIEIERSFEVEKVYPDHLSIIRWFPGIGLNPHVDDMTDSSGEGSEWFHHREFGIVVYLNDNFEGGHTYYPNHDVEVKPKAGRLVIHPGDQSHRHGVKAAKDGTRYTLSSFWTQDVSYFDDWISKYES